MLFPRLQKRGPIEAHLSLWQMVCHECFHAYKSVAPLKRINPPSTGQQAYGFPRLQKRGPIEARATGRARSAQTARFHAYKSVAPLKLSSRRSDRRPGRMFPRLQKRGPIEA